METTTGLATQEHRAILHVAACAALRDRGLDERERRRLTEGPCGARSPDDAPFQDPDDGLEAAIGRLGRPAARELAFDAALAACSADGLRTNDETRFLAHLGRTLGLPHPHIVWRAAIADGLATAPLEDGLEVPVRHDRDQIARAATRCGALAFSAEPLAALAVVAVELRLLHRLVGEGAGAADARAARALVLQLGGGLASQVLDVVSAQLLPQEAIEDDAAGAPAGAAARRAFAHAFAIGHLALGRTEPGAVASAAYLDRYATGEAQFPSHQTSIEALAERVDPLRLLAFVREEASG